jgi:histone H3/H4
VELTGSLMTQHSHRTVSSSAATYMTAVLEYMSAEILELSGKQACDDGRTVVTPRDISLGVNTDEELRMMYSTRKATIIGGGVLPEIHPMFLPKGLKGEEDKDKDEAGVAGEAASFRFVGEALDLNAEIEELKDPLKVEALNVDLSKPEEKKEREPFHRRMNPIGKLMTHHAIGALCARAGVLKISHLTDEELRRTTLQFMHRVIRDTIVCTEHEHIYREGSVPVRHVLAALEQQGRHFWGLGQHMTASDDTSAPSAPWNVPANLHSAFPDLIFDWQSAAAAVDAARKIKVNEDGDDDEDDGDEEGEQKTDDCEETEERAWAKDSEKDKKEEEGKEDANPDTVRHLEALRMIRQEQVCTGPCIPYLLFSEIVDYVKSDYSRELHFSVATKRVLLEVVQSDLISLLADANLGAINSGRDYVCPKDIQYARRIRGDHSDRSSINW